MQHDQVLIVNMKIITVKLCLFLVTIFVVVVVVTKRVCDVQYDSD